MSSHGRKVTFRGKGVQGRLVVLALLPALISGCAMWQKPRTLEQVRANLECLEAKAGLPWEEVSTQFGAPDEAPLPQPQRGLSGNARVYRDTHIILYTERQSFAEEGKLRFHEVVTKVEICRKR